MEYSYFLVYLVLLGTALHTFLFSLNRWHARIIEYENSLILKLLYWPVLMAAQLAITVVFFY